MQCSSAAANKLIIVVFQDEVDHSLQRKCYCMCRLGAYLFNQDGGDALVGLALAPGQAFTHSLQR